MNGFEFSVLERETSHRDSTTPYARRQRELEEQAFYERFGRQSDLPSIWKRAVTPVTATIVVAAAAVGAIFVALRESLGT